MIRPIFLALALTCGVAHATTYELVCDDAPVTHSRNTGVHLRPHGSHYSRAHHHHHHRTHCPWLKRHCRWIAGWVPPGDVPYGEEDAVTGNVTDSGWVVPVDIWAAQPFAENGPGYGNYSRVVDTGAAQTEGTEEVVSEWPSPPPKPIPEIPSWAMFGLGALLLVGKGMMS